jgi:sporulation protein YunB
MKLPKIKLLNKKRYRVLLTILCVLLTMAIGIWLMIEQNLKPIALTVAEARVRAIASDAVNNAVRTAVQGVGYDDLITVVKDAQGRVSMLQANSVRMNQLAADTSLTAQHFISQIDMRTVSIPLGSIFGNPVLAGRGPSIPVRIMPTGSVTSSFQTNFTSAGINQTRHEVYLQLTATMRIAIPNGARDMEVEVVVPVAESVIVGDVPDTYVDTQQFQGALPLIPE